jgi:dolichol-phosphate mannosyltransferase
MASDPQILIFTATYNEVENIEIWYGSIRNSFPSHNILIVDDSSQDGTNEILHKIQNFDSRFIVITRDSKKGVGSAHFLAMNYAFDNGYEHLITLDADLSHQSKDLPALIAHSDKLDFVIGSRWNKQGRCDYKGLRFFLSRYSNVFARFLLPTGLTEYTTSFRIFNRHALQILRKTPPGDDGYSFFFETVEILFAGNAKMGEVPIHFLDRHSGKSKIPSNQIIISSIVFFKLVCSRIKRSITE